MKPPVTIEYSPKCLWLLRAAHITQEFLNTFESELDSVALKPSDVKGDFHTIIKEIAISAKKLFDEESILRSYYSRSKPVEALSEL